jgi:hypothetical protein
MYMKTSDLSAKAGMLLIAMEIVKIEEIGHGAIQLKSDTLT